MNNLSIIYTIRLSLITVVCKKKNPCAKKKWAEDKKPFRNKFYIFVDKLNIIDFNIFNMLKLIFTCESVAYLLQNSFVNVSFNSNLFFLVFNFDCLFKDWPVVRLLYFGLSPLDTLFTLFPEIIVRLIFWDFVKLLSHDTSERLESLWILSIMCREFCDALTWLSIVSFSYFIKQSAVSDFLKVFKVLN